ncbi:Phox domain-containing protein [Rozella allomycis CSF55]|uniref:Phox domain-containing protein n=1 Tax=Rozella allomycis (strain CSF55) TaxID=988480 RepID=A0A075ANP9_ROZAC|nr:Phox domain-containing protein [Rozella allomycis CSF55]|eukprot:EPZ31522.1 Phox domain-containing protein [Rozella allomycis CSF55]
MQNKCGWVTIAHVLFQYPDSQPDLMDEFETTPGTVFSANYTPGVNYENLTTSMVSSEPTTSMNTESKPVQKDVFCCSVDRLLSQHNETKRCPSGPLQVISIVDAHKNTDGTGNHYLYQIVFKNFSVKRRYSDFESLRNILSSFHPVVVIPPIPEKHSLCKLALIDLAISEKRERMLQTFLNRIVEHPVLCSHHLFHRFLEENKNWNDIVASENIKKDEASASASKLKNPDPKFLEIENDNSYYSHSLIPLIKHRKEFQGNVKNLSTALEMVGEGIDGIHLSTNNLGAYFEECFGESLHEYALYSQSVKNVLRYRRGKQLELETIQDEHFAKQNQLLQLEGTVVARKNSVVTNITNHLSNMLDTSPEMSRKHGISKTKDIITQVNDELERFQATRQRIIKSYVLEQINHYKANIDTWEKNLEKVEAEL